MEFVIEKTIFSVAAYAGDFMNLELLNKEAGSFWFKTKGEAEAHKKAMEKEFEDMLGGNMGPITVMIHEHGAPFSIAHENSGVVN